MFLNDDISRQAGTMALVPQVVDAVKVPVIAAAGSATDGHRGGAGAGRRRRADRHRLHAYAGSQDLGMHRAALKQANDNSTTLTNIFTGGRHAGIVNRYVREVGPISADAPQFPLAASASQPMRTAAEAKGSPDFTPLWSGQAPTFARELPTRR